MRGSRGGLYCTAQLESQVAQLTAVVNNIELKLGYKPSQIPSGKDDQFSGPDDSEGESSGSDIPMAEKPSHLQSLFQNDWLSADPCQHERQTEQRIDKIFAQLSIDVRPKLQNMIPPKDEVADIAGSAYDWLTVLHALFPQPLMLNSPQELLKSFESMCRPNVDVIMLASWLLTLALTAQQIHPGREGSDVYMRKWTARYQLTAAAPLNADGSIHLTTYLTRLLDISIKVYDLEEFSATHESSMKRQMAALEMAQALGELAGQAPDTWWAGDERDHITPEDIVQFLHCCVLMRVYLPFALKQNLRDELVYARLPCMNACEAVARRYLVLRRKLPAGLFMSRVLDLQALTAASVLLLLSHHVRSTDRHSFRIDISHLHGVVSDIITLIGERARDPTNSDLAVEAYNTLRALDQLLRQDDHTREVERLTVTVPLLGKIHVRRNARSAPQPRVANQPSSQLESNMGIQTWTSASHPLDGQSSLGTNIPVNEADPSPDEWRLTDLSWSVEGSLDNLLEDAFLSESIGQYVDI
ncbi:hypothetical protein OAory_01039430 [Aspergillus oryzae]|uniref:Zn(II)2Cys6 transcription factor n=1 Tax=Aspergillus oryzae TaxID=5062 RepID=A0A1S9DEB3_ASPOZ|nr:hypothetical protein OAory_01039430 [Aspergillus oryzae]